MWIGPREELESVDPRGQKGLRSQGKPTLTAAPQDASGGPEETLVIHSSSKEATAGVVSGTPKKANATPDRTEVNREPNGVPAKIRGREEKLFGRKARESTVEGESCEPKVARPNRKKQPSMKTITMEAFIDREDNGARLQVGFPPGSAEEHSHLAGDSA